MHTIEQIDQEIATLQKKLKQVKGTRTEVYTRIVGYHRAVQNWNNGKREEYKYRKTFKVSEGEIAEKMTFSHVNEKDNFDESAKKNNSNTADSASVAFYKMFTSQYCRNCSPVKEYLKEIPIVGEEVDVTTDIGVAASRKYNILSTPTVILFDNNDNVVDMIHSVDELKKVFSAEKVMA